MRHSFDRGSLLSIPVVHEHMDLEVPFFGGFTVELLLVPPFGTSLFSPGVGQDEYRMGEI